MKIQNAHLAAELVLNGWSYWRGGNFPRYMIALFVLLATLNPSHGQHCRSLDGNKAPVWSVAFSLDSKMLFSGGEDGVLRCWDVASGKLRANVDADKIGLNALAFSLDGKRMASAGHRNILLWDLPKLEVTKVFNNHGSYATGVAFSPDSSTVASGSIDGIVRIRSVASGKELVSFPQRIRTLAFSHKRDLLATGDGSGMIRFWNPKNARNELSIKAHSKVIMAIAISPDDRKVASACYDNIFKLWDIRSGNLIKAFKGHEDVVASVAFTADGQILASGSCDKTIKLWKLPEGKLIVALAKHRECVLSVAFSSDGNWMASGGGNFIDRTPGEVYLWKVSDLVKVGNVSTNQTK